MSNVVIYTSAWCPFCLRAKALLDHKDVSYKEIEAPRGTAARDEMVKLSNRNTVPQIFIGETHVGGCDDLFALEQAGKLDDLLA